jgi:hypothetical protein
MMEGQRTEEGIGQGSVHDVALAERPRPARTRRYRLGYPTGDPAARQFAIARVMPFPLFPDNRTQTPAHPTIKFA